MIAAEEAISIVPEYCVSKLKSVDNITFCPLQGDGETEEVLAVWDNRNANPALQHFINQFRE